MHPRHPCRHGHVAGGPSHHTLMPTHHRGLVTRQSVAYSYRFHAFHSFHWSQCVQHISRALDGADSLQQTASHAPRRGDHAPRSPNRHHHYGRVTLSVMRCNHDWRCDSEDQTHHCHASNAQPPRLLSGIKLQKVRASTARGRGRRGDASRMHRGSRRLYDILDTNVFSTCSVVSDGEVQRHQN